MNTDTELLRRYLDGRSEAAFTELVQRHIGLVYSVALRRVGGDAHLAEDVAQKVFCDLARKAPSLIGRASLAGWLYAAAHVTSAAVVRSERRRKTREFEAHTMQTTLPSVPEADWTRLRPVIDDAIVVLKDEEREAIALRFFEQRSFADIGAALRVSEEAARKRVDRALDKLRNALTRRGVTSTAGALGVALTAIAATSAPAEVGARVASQALASASASAGGSIIGGIVSATLPAAAVLLLGAMLITSQRQTNRELRAEMERLAGQHGAVAALRAENKTLARHVRQADELREMQAQLPRLRSALLASPASPVTPAPATAALTVTPQGTIAWGADFVNLQEFIARARALSARSAESKIVIRAPGAGFSALAYVIDEVRKAGIRNVIVESNATPNPKMGFSWF